MRVNFIRSLLIELSVISDIDVAPMVVRGVIGGSVVHCSQQPRQVRRGPPLGGGGVDFPRWQNYLIFPNLRSRNTNLIALAKFYSKPFIVGKKEILNVRPSSQQIVLCTTYLY